MSARRVVPLAVLAALLVAVVAPLASSAEGHPSLRVVGPNAPWHPAHPLPERPTDRRPNIIWILTDDMRTDELRYMPNVRRLLVRKGTTYTHAVSPHPVCCPARASMLTGQYAQNNGVQHNGGPWGGFHSLSVKTNTIGSWLTKSHYLTYFVGKYLNGYYTRPAQTKRERQQWTRWDASLKGTYGYGLVPLEYADGDVVRGTYITHVVTGRTNATLARFAKPGTPFFMWINHLAPHPGFLQDNRPTLPKPEARYRHIYGNAQAPSLHWPSFNRLVKGDARFGQGSYRQTVALVNARFRARIRALRSVDDSVGNLVANLRRKHELANTYIAFTSDNGYQFGEHGINGKNTLYRESLDVPLVVRGPGIKHGAKVSTPVTLLDLVASTAEWAGITPGRTIDGLPFDQVRRKRDTILIQLGDAVRDSTPGWQYRGVLTGRYTYAQVAGHPGRGALFDDRRDPFQIHNQWTNPGYAAVRRELARRTKVLSTCSGPASCNRVFGPTPKVG